MAKKLIDILSAAAVVRDETNEKANTAERVGGVLVELANYLSAFAPVSDVTVEAEGESVRLVLHLKNENGTLSTRSVTLPAASTENAGVLTAELLKALQAADKENEDLAKDGISKAESASAMLFAEEAARKEADLSLNDLIEAEVTERLQSVETEAAARKAADAELQAKIQANEDLAKEGLSKAESASAMLFAEEAERKEADLSLNDLIEAEVTERLQSVATEAAARKAADAELQAKIQDHEDRIWKLENQWYGIEWDTEVSSPAVTRIGNMDLHRTLPIQSRMRGCLLDDNGKVTKYLNPKDWTGEVRDGSRGQVMVEIPSHYRRFETDGTKRRVKMSEYPLPGFNFVKMVYLSANEATIQRSTGKLASVVNSDPDFRGGNNNAAWDGTYRSFLGRPVTSISRTAFRTAARKRKSGSSEWNCYTYDIHKTLFWLFVVEYATLNSQTAYNAELTSEGYRQGGLGAGVTDLNSSKWSTFNGYYPFIPCGFTDSLGNGTGVVPFTMPTEYDPDAQFPVTTNVPRYRGVENPFGHIWQWTDGINVRISPTVENGGDGLSKVFVGSDPALFKDNGYDGYSHVGNEARNSGYVKEIIGGEYGEIMTAICSGAGSTTFFCDYHNTHIPTAETLRGVLFGGDAADGSSAGFAYAYSLRAPSYTGANIGSRLCFIPA